MTNDIIILKEGLTFFDKSITLSWNRYNQRQNMSDGIQTPVSETAPKEYPVHYSKSHFHRVIHVDGLYGGSTPTLGEIIVHFFSHYLPLPEQSANDMAGKEVMAKRIVKPGVEREVEASLVMNVETAKSMVVWLNDRIEYAEKLLPKSGVK